MKISINESNNSNNNKTLKAKAPIIQTGGLWSNVSS